MLRRPPTRIELKADDIEEYEQLKKAQQQVKGLQSSTTPKKDTAQRIGLTSKK
jgi:hypothetical protein